jgi:cytochrome c biogenesis protein CcmG/thiol:disulfide interchange protein DsbE
MKKNLLAVAVVSVALTGMAVAQGTVQNMVGKQLPTFSLTDTNGRTINNSTLRGKVAVIDFWASWCGPCKQIAPVLQRIHQDMSGQGVMVIGANTSDKEEAARNYLRTANKTFPVTLNSDRFASALGVRALPTVVLVDKNGRIARVFVGTNNLDRDLRAAIRQLL